jgi:diphthine-ammonia ligase
MQQVKNKRAVVLWTGGKDCNLALHEAKMEGYDIVSLISFAMYNARFRAHPLSIMEKQSRALGIPHAIVSLMEPYKDSYEEAILQLKIKYQIDTIITGDIAEIHGNTNWITERSKPAGINVFLPLWHLDRQQILQRLFSLNFKIIFSCVKEPWFTSSWLGKELNIRALGSLKLIHKSQGLDICGEQGEYHTLVLDGPLYKHEIIINSFAEQKDESIMYMEMRNVSLKEKQLI